MRASAAEHFATFRNELLRQALRPLFRLVGWRAGRDLGRRIADHAREQERLRVLYGVTASTPVRPWSDAVAAEVEAWAATHVSAELAERRESVRFACTSGSTAKPKRIAYTRERLAALRRANTGAAAQAARVHGIGRPTLFAFTALREDDSLSSMLLEEGRRVGFTDGLVMPSRHLGSQALAPLVAEHGATAVRLWLLALSNPGLLYATNPSTLAGFLGAVHGDWQGSTGVVRAHVVGKLPKGAAAVGRRVLAPGWRARLELVARAHTPPPVEAWLPGLRAYCCWDGGYVAPFLERLRRHLPAPRFAHVPMYSMSTETLETLLFYEGQTPRFLPLGEGVLYELLPDGAEDDPALLVPARAAQVGRDYTLVVSDPYGLVRYQTCDLFRCAGRVGEVPDLRFLRRRGLTYSFTGEKLAGAQVEAAFAALKAARPALRTLGVQLALLPSLPGPDVSPCYRLVLAHPADVRPDELPVDGLGPAFDALLGAENRELASKLASGRLGPTQVVVLAYEELAAALDGRTSTSDRAWENQFKLLPLYTRTWESVPGLAAHAPVAVPA